MDIIRATRMLGAIAQETRLSAFRFLVRAGREGVPAGALARTLEVPHNTLSSHLGILTNAGLVASQREGRSIRYRVDLDGTRALLAFLMEDCCRGSREVCAPALDTVLAGCDD